MPSATSNLTKMAPFCLFVNGAIFLFYALSVPTYIPRGIHWLITLAAVLFIVALPAIYQMLGQVNRNATKAVAAIFGFGMIIIVISDIMFALSLVSRFQHDLMYAAGDALFVLCLLAIGVLAWRSKLPKWFATISLVAGILGVLSYLPGLFPIVTISLVLVAIWSFATGYVLRVKK